MFFISYIIQKLPWIYLIAFSQVLSSQILGSQGSCYNENARNGRVELGKLRIRTLIKYIFGAVSISNEVYHNTINNLRRSSDEEPNVIEVVHQVLRYPFLVNFIRIWFFTSPTTC